jgi:hypothetical protein
MSEIQMHDINLMRNTPTQYKGFLKSNLELKEIF